MRKPTHYSRGLYAALASLILVPATQAITVTVVPTVSGNRTATVGLNTVDYTVTLTRTTENGATSITLAGPTTLPTGVSYQFLDNGQPVSNSTTAFASGQANTKAITLRITANSSSTPDVTTSFNVGATTNKGTATSLSETVTVAYEALSIGSISPTSGFAGTSVPVTITGHGFTRSGNGTTVNVTRTSGNAASGITVNNVTVADDGKSLTGTFVIDPGANISGRNVSVTTAKGTSGTTGFTVTQAAVSTTTTVSASPANPVYGNNVVLSATVSSSSGVPTGTVAFSDNGVLIPGAGSVAVSSGVATFTYVLPTAISHPISAVYTPASGTNFVTSTGTTSVTVAKANQTITASPSSVTRTYGDADFTISATGGGSGNAVTFSSSNPGVATVSATGVVHIVGAGSTTILLNEAGNNNYNAAAQASVSVQIDKKAQILSFLQAASLTANGLSAGSLPATIAASADSGLGVQYSLTSPVSGLSINSSTGQLSLATGLDKDASVSITASNAGDNNYLAGQQTLTFSLFENTAPTVDHTTGGTPSAGGWYNSNVDVTLTGTDAGSGISEIWYSVNGGNWVKEVLGIAQASVTKKVTLTQEGSNTLSYYFVDAHGNKSDVKSLAAPIKIDKTVPVITASVSKQANAAGWHNAPFDVTFSATDDNGSGVVTVSGVKSVIGPDNADLVVTATATDEAGNTATQDFHYKYDATAPVPIVGSPVSGQYMKTASVAGISAQEDLSGIASTKVYLSDAASKGTWFDYSADAAKFHEVPTNALPLAMSKDTGYGDGNYTLVVVKIDAAGNQGQQSVNFTVDGGKPNLDLTQVPLNGSALKLPVVDVKSTVSDDVDPSPFFFLKSLLGDLNGIDGFDIPANSTVPKDAWFSAAAEGLYRLTLQGSDHADNLSDLAKSTFVIDRTAPSTELSLLGDLGIEGWYRSSVKVTLTSADKPLRLLPTEIPGSGIGSILYSLDGANVVSKDVMTTEVVISGESDKHTLDYAALDKAGNQEFGADGTTVKRATVKIDLTKPVFDVDTIHNIEVTASSRAGAKASFAPKASDALSGLDGDVVSTIGAGIPVDSNTTFPINGEQPTTVNLSVKDKAGNVETASFTVTVKKMSQTLSFSGSVSATYGDAPLDLGAKTDADGLEPSVEVTSGPGVIENGKLRILGAGSIVLTATQAGDEAYNAAAPVTKTIEVAKAKLHVTVGNATKVYGDANPGFSMSFDGFKNGDNQGDLGTIGAPTTAASETTGVGIYDIVHPNLSSTNYDFDYTDGSLEVTPAPLTVKANNAVKTYGQANPTFSVQYIGARNDDTNFGTVSFATSAVAKSPVGNYPITPSGASNSNYTIDFAPGQLTVSPAALTVSAVKVTREYGEVNPSFQYTTSGLVDGDTLNVSFSTIATKSSSVGSYTINVDSVTGGDSTNYTIETAPATLTITPAPLTVKATSYSSPYGTLGRTYTGQITGLKNNDAITGTWSGGDVTEKSGIGDYAIVASLTDNDSKLSNYELTSLAGILSITPIALTVTATDATVKLNSATVPLAYTAPELKGWDTIGFQVALSDPTLTSQIGVYAGGLVPSFSGDPAGPIHNYNVKYVSGKLSVVFASNSGVLQPVNSDGSSVFKQGSTIPVKIKVYDANGVSVSTPGTIVSFTQFAVGTVSSSVNEAAESTTPDTAFRWDATAQQWIFNMSTKSLSAGKKYTYRIMFKDNTFYDVIFGLK